MYSVILKERRGSIKLYAINAVNSLLLEHNESITTACLLGGSIHKGLNRLNWWFTNWGFLIVY